MVARAANSGRTYSHWVAGSRYTAAGSGFGPLERTFCTLGIPHLLRALTPPLGAAESGRIAAGSSQVIESGPTAAGTATIAAGGVAVSWEQFDH